MAWLNIKKRCILRWKHVVKWTHIAKNKQLLLNICYPQHMLLKGRDKRRYVTVTVSQTMNWLPSKQIKQHHLFFLSDTQALCPSIWMRFDHWILREELTIPINTMVCSMKAENVIYGTSLSTTLFILSVGRNSE